MLCCSQLLIVTTTNFVFLFRFKQCSSKWSPLPPLSYFLFFCLFNVFILPFMRNKLCSNQNFKPCRAISSTEVIPTSKKRVPSLMFFVLKLIKWEPASTTWRNRSETWWSKQVQPLFDPWPCRHLRHIFPQSHPCHRGQQKKRQSDFFSREGLNY